MFNKKNIASSIIQDEKTWLFQIIMPWINRDFESIIFSYDWKIIVYWKLKSQDFSFLDFWNYLLWFTSFFWFKVICFINLDDLSSKYFFVKSFDIFDFVLLSNSYFCFFYKDYKDELWFYSNLESKEFHINFMDKKIIIRNNIFWTKVFEKDLNFIIKKEDNIFDIIKYNDKNDFLDVADFFIFDDFFVKSYWFKDFYNFLLLFYWKAIKIKKDLFIKIAIEKYENIFFQDLK